MYVRFLCLFVKVLSSNAATTFYFDMNSVYRGTDVLEFSPPSSYSELSATE